MDWRLKNKQGWRWRLKKNWRFPTPMTQDPPIKNLLLLQLLQINQLLAKPHLNNQPRQMLIRLSTRSANSRRIRRGYLGTLLPSWPSSREEPRLWSAPSVERRSS